MEQPIIWSNLKEPLVTNNPNEMQINQNGTYGLSFGLFDDAKHEITPFRKHII